MAKSLKLSAKEKRELEALFKDGLTKASKNPKKYWEMERDRHNHTPPYKGFGTKKKK